MPTPSTLQIPWIHRGWTPAPSSIVAVSIYLVYIYAGVQPRWIQGLRRVDGVGVRKTYLLIDIRLD